MAPRRLARPASLRPLQAAGVAAQDTAAAAAEAEGSEGVHSLAGSGVLEPALTWPARTHGCGEVTEADVGREVTVCGWVDRYRNLGGILFLDIRDHSGVVQVIVDPQAQPEVAAKAERLRAEWVVAVSGALRLRTDPNPRMKTGTLEISPSGIKVRGQRWFAAAGGGGEAGRQRCWQGSGERCGKLSHTAHGGYWLRLQARRWAVPNDSERLLMAAHVLGSTLPAACLPAHCCRW